MQQHMVILKLSLRPTDTMWFIPNYRMPGQINIGLGPPEVQLWFCCQRRQSPISLNSVLISLNMITMYSMYDSAVIWCEVDGYFILFHYNEIVFKPWNIWKYHYPNIPISQYLNLPLSQYLNIKISQYQSIKNYPYINISPYLSIKISPYLKIPISKYQNAKYQNIP